MYKYEISKRIEEFAPLETQEEWDCSGWGVNINNYDEINRIMLSLTVTDNIVKQARKENCDMIVSHHPCFYIPIEWSNINIYSAHTNLDKAKGGTTDTLINKLGLSDYKINAEHDFLRFIEYKTTTKDFNKKIKEVSPNARLINNNKKEEFNKIAFCSGSGSEFIQEAKNMKADCLVTGDLKFHTALDSEIAVYDIGHFESEIIILPVLEKIIGSEVEIIYAKEKSPFIYI